MEGPRTVPASVDELRAAILEEYDSLSKRLKQIARYVLDEPSAVALETVAVLAERTGVQPSAIVRFAKHFGFDGASQMQRLFVDGLLGSVPQGYGERVREFTREVDSKAVGDPAQVLSEFVGGNLLALQNLGKAIGREELANAVALLSEAGTVHVTGVRRSFPVAAYLAYSLHQAGKRTVLVDNVGGMAMQQVHSISSDDLLVAVSYHPYAEETVHLVEAAVARGARVLTITDSLVSRVAKPAVQVLQVREAEIRKFRSLSVSMCLAQALVISYAFANPPAEPPQPVVAAARRRRKK